MIYSKDPHNGVDTFAVNYSNVFGRVDKTALDLINACRYIYHDSSGEYFYKAMYFDESDNVIFVKCYRKQTKPS